jgi:tripartite-type tricarboxylate transporter receptor subunit TctC
MTFSRRKLLQIAAGAVVLPFAPHVARTQTYSSQAYPSRPVRLVVGFTPGGAVDIIARLIGQALSERLGKPFVIENRPGAATNLATESVVRAAADGYTLLMANTAAAINATLYDKLNFNFIRDIAAVAGVMRGGYVVEVHPSFPAKTLAEFIAYAKANPGTINMGSAGSGASDHMAGELFKMMTGVNLVHVPYRGAAPALADLLGAQVQVMFGSLPASIEYIRSGKLRGLAVTTSTRSEALPDLPTVSDFVPGYEASGWYGVCAPSRTPVEIVDKLNQEINATLADPKLKARLAELGGAALPDSPADFAKLIAEETEKWGKVVRAANIKPE